LELQESDEVCDLTVEKEKAKKERNRRERKQRSPFQKTEK
jgi:hypothetical protein